METVANHIEAVYEKAKSYTETSIELYKLNAIDSTVDLASSLAIRVAIILIVSMFALFVNIAISLFIGSQLGHYSLGFLIVSGFYLFMAFLIYFFREQFIKTPIANMIISKLMKSKKSNNVTPYNKLEDDENGQK